MAIDTNQCRAELQAGFGVPDLISVLRPVAMDPERLQQFVTLWNTNQIQSPWDIITSQFVTDSRFGFAKPAAPPGIVLTVQDSEVLHVVRLTVSGLVDGEAIDPDLITVDLSVGSQAHITSEPVPISHVAGNGLNSWLLPIPIRLGKTDTLKGTFNFAASVGETIERLDFTAHCIRLKF